MPYRFKLSFIRRVATACACSLLLAAFVLADNYPRQPSIDILNYLFKLELKDDANMISGETDIDLMCKADGVTELFLDLIGKSADGKTGMTVGDATRPIRQEISPSGCSSLLVRVGRAPHDAQTPGLFASMPRPAAGAYLAWKQPSSPRP